MKLKLDEFLKKNTTLSEKVTELESSNMKTDEYNLQSESKHFSSVAKKTADMNENFINTKLDKFFDTQVKVNENSNLVQKVKTLEETKQVLLLDLKRKNDKIKELDGVEKDFDSQKQQIDHIKNHYENKISALESQMSNFTTDNSKSDKIINEKDEVINCITTKLGLVESN